ncbi:ribosomal protein S18 acetylase RimI-like enzyme [Nocardia tenerifensis]|uniref:Ribosomal protein S18 acetylase RimI-like enzyme n=1 Tax=Nocardia tenerifensis TaxID=228006 RepID=A0A318KBQ2_9NOCA|nr:GNAT family N-acetyltransferase [Nocardia tenerifensis]PXX69182.1 ribosomal protein S18 acetylase RimI-like enzyme [Nocardia tenerifensis]
MVDEVEVRAARAEDAATIARIWYAGWCDAHLGNVPDELIAGRPRESFDRRAAERVSDTTVATVGGVVAGFVMVLGDEVNQVYVSGDHRGSGLAARLLAAAEDRLRADGHHETWLVVVPGNARARKFYENHGWIDDGPHMHTITGTAGPVDVPTHRYVKRLD